MSDFKEAAENEDTCSICVHFQPNKKLPNVRDGLICTHEENKQNGYYGQQLMDVKSDFLCSRFELNTK